MHYLCLAMVPPNPSSSDQAGEPCASPPGEAGSPVSLLSSSSTVGGGTTRVTFDPTFTVTTGIVAITATAAAVVLTTGQEDATPTKEGRATANLLPPPLVKTRCKLGLHSSRMGGGEIPSPTSPRPLSNKRRLVTLKNTNYENKREHEYIPR